MAKFDSTDYNEIMRDERMFKPVKRYQETALICSTGKYKYNQIQIAAYLHQAYLCPTCGYHHTK